MQMHNIERYVLIERGQRLVCLCLTDKDKTFTL